MHVVRRAALSILMVAAVALTACHGSSSNTTTTIPPTATFKATVSSVAATSLTVAVDATGSSSSDGSTPTYSWNFGDQTPSTSTQATTGLQVTHVYAQPGSYMIVLTVTDDHASTAAKAIAVTVTATSATANTTPYSGNSSAGGQDWVWLGGLKYANGYGSYRTQFTADANNLPSARQYAATWTAPGTTNTSGKLWMFGGSGYDSNGTSGFLNDLWYFTPAACDPATGNCGKWTWVSGSNKANVIGVYTTDANGNPSFSPTNMPGARVAVAGWTDTAGNFWMFGGNGYDSAGTLGNLNDLWVFNAATGQANWIAGSKLANDAGSSTTPSSRSYATTWTDKNGRFWLFGGETVNASGTTSTLLNDLWYFTPSKTTGSSGQPVFSGTWTQVKAGTANGSGTYGTLNTAASTNYPGARINAQTWVDASGIVWMFGGSGIDSASNSGAMNDMWSFDGTTWTWVAGANTIGGSEVTGTKGTAASGNTPSARLGTTGWIDASGGPWLWLFGGSGTDSTGTSATSDGGGALNEQWAFNTQTRHWAFVGGSTTAGTAGVFALGLGAEQTPDPLTGGTIYYNVPGARVWSNAWVDSNKHLWLFGGTGEDMSGNSGYLNDLWQVKIVTPLPISN